MLHSIEYIRNEQNEITGLLGVNVANPALGSSTLNGLSFYTLDQIDRWDIFKVAPTRQFYDFVSYNQGRFAIPNYSRR
jgi:hypothetical protein